jgi:DNA-3-methyladenine glycosylase I
VTATYLAPDGDLRCAWSGSTPDYLAYHDTEWGFPVVDDRRLFEKISLEGFQSGLSWRTILAKRDNFRAAFRGFDFVQVASFTPGDVERLLQDPGIVRHRGKIEAVVNNAGRTIDLVEEAGSIAAYVWRFEDPEPDRVPDWRATSPASEAMSRDLKKRGWRFVGPTTAYAFMQAMGLVNDHDTDCVVRARVAKARAAFTPPS